MTIPSDVAERIEKLISLLGSDNEGEAIGAARAIKRILRAAGLDFHALAASIRPRTVWRDAAFATPGFNYANEFRQAQPTGVRPDHPDALRPLFGLCLYTAERVESWMEVGRHCLELDRKTRSGTAVDPCETSRPSCSPTLRRAAAGPRIPRRLGWRRSSLAASRRAMPTGEREVKHDR